MVEEANLPGGSNGSGTWEFRIYGYGSITKRNELLDVLTMRKYYRVTVLVDWLKFKADFEGRGEDHHDLVVAQSLESDLQFR